MTKRTTILLEDRLYEKLMSESVEEYASSKHLSELINKLLKVALNEGNVSRIKAILKKPRIVKITNKEFEKFRHELSGSAEGR